MADPTDDLLQSMTQAGLYPEQIAQLQRRFQIGQGFMQPQEAGGRQVGGTYVASSPLEHLSNALRPLMGALIQRSALQKEQALTSQLSSGRQAFARALQDKMGKPGEFMPGGAGDQQGLQQLALMAAGSGDSAMQNTAQMYMQEQNQGRQLAILGDRIRHEQEMEDQGRGRLGLGQQHIDAMNKRLALQGVRYNPNTSQFENISGLAKPPRKSALPLSTSNAAPAAPPSTPPSDDGNGPPPGPAPAPLGKWQDKALKELGADFNPSSGRSGEFGKNQARVNAANRVMGLAVDENGNAKDLNPQQMAELAQSVASLISSGGQGAQAQIEHLLPKSYTRDAAGILQYLTSEPHGAGQTAFVTANVDLAKREQKIAQQGIDQVRGQLVSKHQRILRSNPEEARKVLQGFGWDLGPDGTPVMQQAGGAKQVLKYQQNTARGVKRAVYSDGSYGPEQPL